MKLEQKYPYLTKELLYTLYVTKNLKQTEIAKKYNVHQSAISALLRRFSIKTKTQSEIMEERIANGQSPWNKGLTVETDERVKLNGESISKAKKGTCCGENNHFYGKTHTEEVKKRLSLAQVGKKASEETKRLMSISRTGENNGFYGKNHSLETRKRLSLIRGGDGNLGIANGGYPISFNNRLRASVKERDNHTCQLCNIRQDFVEQTFHVHHIDYDKNNSDISNLITLCHSCHSRTNTDRDYWIAVLEQKLYSPILV